MTLVAEAAREERQRVVRALLVRQTLTPEDPELALARRHREELAQALRDQLGATLTVTPDTAHLTKRLTLAEARPLRLEPRSANERRRPVDERRRLDGHAALLVCLIAGVLERRMWTQVPLGVLADEVVTHAQGLSVTLDWRARADRAALADGVEWLGGRGVLTLRAGQAGSFQDEHEAFYDVHRRRLALLLADPVGCAEAAAPEDLEPVELEAGDLAGRGRARRIVARLVEDPVLYLDDLSEEDRSYFLAQRLRLEDRARLLTGLTVERRQEGTALVVEGRGCSDRPFPAQGAVKQLALLLLPDLCARDVGTTLATEAIAALVRDLVRRHAAHWPWEPDETEAVQRAGGQALAVLVDLRLLAEVDGGHRVLPLAHRYRDAASRVSRADQMELL